MIHLNVEHFQMLGIKVQMSNSAFEPKTIVAIIAVAFIIGAFIWLQIRKRNKK